jgi:hypothetical protein
VFRENDWVDDISRGQTISVVVSGSPRLNRVPREFVYVHAHELGAICLRLRDANGRASAKFERGGRHAFPPTARFALQ